jgi:hypothetical protein
MRLDRRICIIVKIARCHDPRIWFMNDGNSLMLIPTRDYAHVVVCRCSDEAEFLMSQPTPLIGEMRA